MAAWAFFPDQKKTPVTFQSHRGTMFKKYDINQNIMAHLRSVCMVSFKLI